MTKSKAKLYYTSSQYLDQLPIANGQIIFVPDNNLVCLDMREQRFKYHTIQIFTDDQARLAAKNLVEGFYYVESTNVAWRFINDS